MGIRRILTCAITLGVGLGACLSSSDGGSGAGTGEQSAKSALDAGVSPGDGDGDGLSGSCPDLGGDWTVVTHCDASLVGMTMTFDQTGCSFTLAQYGVTGTVSADSSFVLEGSTGTGRFECTGTATATTLSEACDSPNGGEPCTVTLSR